MRSRCRSVLVVLSSLAFGCGAGEPPASVEDLRFPPGFRFGTAIAGFQAEMGCPTVLAAQCEFMSDWSVYVTNPELTADKGLYLSGDPLSSGPGFYELYADDLARAQGDLKNDALRLSIEWGRVFPVATDGIEGYDALKKSADPRALAFYHAVFAEMKKRGLHPLVTVIHYALPVWIHDAYGCHVDLDKCSRRGWLDHDRILREAAKYAGFLGREFGAEVDDWATENEPFTAVVVAGYVFQTESRTNPPAVSLRGKEAREATIAEIEGHARMYDALRAADTVDADGDGKAARVGLVYNLEAVGTSDPKSDVDVAGAKNFDYLINRLFLDATIKGDLDVAFDGHPVHRDDLAGRMDFLGVNYYARAVVPGTETSIFPAISPLLTFNPLVMETDWSYPRGIYEVLVAAKAYGVPLVVTETGVEDGKDTGAAAKWIVQTLTWVKRAIADGVPVEGYYYWTFMDNYEWNHGMNVKMGLYAVDPKDPRKLRTPRSAAGVYARIASLGEIPADLVEKYPTPR